MLQIGLHPGQRRIWALCAIAIVVIRHEREAVYEVLELTELCCSDGRRLPFSCWHWWRHGQDELLHHEM